MVLLRFHPVLRERALRLRKNVLTTVGRLRRLRNRVSASSTDENSRQHEGQGSQHQRQGPRPIAIELTSYFERNFSSDDHHHYGGGEGHGEDGGGGRGGGGGQLDADGEAHFRAIEQCWERAATAAAASHQKKK